MDNFWQPDKIAHYKYCYDHTKKCNNIIWGICVLFGVSFYKEIIHDLIMKKGTPDFGDVLANYYGCKDAIINKERKF